MARTAVAPETVDYPDSDGLPMAENEFQFRSILYANSALAAYYRAHDDVYVVGNLLLYYEPSPRPGVPGKSVSPDLMVVLGAPNTCARPTCSGKSRRRRILFWKLPPKSTYRSDVGDKRDTYAGIGVSEYWLYDPIGGYHDPRLQGFRLIEGRYEPLPVTERTDGVLTGYSEALALALRLYPDDRFRFHDPASGRDLPSLDEAEDRLQESEAARKALEAELRALRHGTREPGKNPMTEGTVAKGTAS